MNTQKTVPDFLERSSPTFLVVFSLALLVAIGCVDSLTGPEISLATFYLLPISIVTWGVSKRVGYYFCMLSIGAWLFADFEFRDTFSHWLIPYWNALVRLASFLIITSVLAKLRERLTHETDLAKKDFLTGLPNSRSFFELVEAAARRSQDRNRPLTLAYVKVDGLNWINERCGPVVGDQLLCIIARVIEENAPESECVARVAGSVFALLLPSSDRDAVNTVLTRLQQALDREIHGKYDRPMTFRISAKTYSKVPENPQQLIQDTEEWVRHPATQTGLGSFNYSEYRA